MIALVASSESALNADKFHLANKVFKMWYYFQNKLLSIGCMWCEMFDRFYGESFGWKAASQRILCACETLGPARDHLHLYVSLSFIVCVRIGMKESIFWNDLTHKKMANMWTWSRVYYGFYGECGTPFQKFIFGVIDRFRKLCKYPEFTDISTCVACAVSCAVLYCVVLRNA